MWSPGDFLCRLISLMLYHTVAFSVCIFWHLHDLQIVAVAKHVLL